MEARKSTGRSRTPAYSTEWSRLQLRRGETQDPNRQQAKQATSMSANKGNGDEEGADVTAPPRCASAAPPPRRASAAQACSPRLPDPLPADAPLPGAQPCQRERREEGRRAALAGTRRAVGGRRATGEPTRTGCRRQLLLRGRGRGGCVAAIMAPPAQSSRAAQQWESEDQEIGVKRRLQ